MLTPVTDKILKIYTFITKEGIVFNKSIKQGQKAIMECILARKAPVEEIIKRLHVMAHTRYGKSMSIAAALCVRSSAKKEPWAIVAGSKEQSQIIMDYVIQFSVNDPILKSLLLNEREINIERLTQRKKRDHITYKAGGEIRAYGAGRDGTAVMGMGCANVVEDESALINDNTQSKIFRMLGDHTDNFYMKVGNPFNNNHFQEAYLNDDYYHINIDYRQGLAEGRITEKFIQEVKKNANFSILYENIFPDEAGVDDRGWYKLFSDKLVRNAIVEADAVEPWGFPKDGCDPADGGTNEAIIVRKWANIAKVIYASAGVDNIQFATEIATRNKDTDESIIDKVGVGSGTFNTLNRQGGIKRRIRPINVGWGVPESVKPEEAEQYFNLRAYLFWQVKLWLEAGNKLVKNDGWKQLLEVRYNTSNPKSKIQIIRKEDLRKYYGVDDLGVADSLSFPFLPEKPRVRHGGRAVGGVKPFNEKLGF